MKVILKEDLTNVGLAGEVVNVKGGYGRNYLIPRGLAVVANKGNTARYEEEARQRAHKLEAARKDAEALAVRLSSLDLVLQMPVGEQNRLFGTVTTQMIADALGEQGFDVDRRKIVLSEEIRLTGVYTAKIKLHTDHTAELKIVVEPDMARAADVSDRRQEEIEAAQEAESEAQAAEQEMEDYEEGRGEAEGAHGEPVVSES